jgi:hypothetical protein
MIPVELAQDTGIGPANDLAWEFLWRPLYHISEMRRFMDMKACIMQNRLTLS